MAQKIDFSHQQREQHENWRIKGISTSEKGFQNKNKYNHIVPKRIWHETLWEGIRQELPKYLLDNKIQAHTGTHNLLSSWVVCANLYFPIRQNKTLRNLMLEFLKQKISDQITEITCVELEFAFPENDPLHPSNLLGEKDGGRGSGQTSPDVVFLVKTKNGNGIVLTECKYTEHSFYTCSARQTYDNDRRKGNPDPLRCMSSANTTNYESICHQSVWERKYWDILNLSEYGKGTLKRCPAATAGYQLFRQQALAEGIMQSGKYSFVASTVAFDDRNTNLKSCLKRTGINDFQTEWSKEFDGKAIFKTWTHQEWVQFVRDNQLNAEFEGWLNYLNERYVY